MQQTPTICDSLPVVIGLRMVQVGPDEFEIDFVLVV